MDSGGVIHTFNVRECVVFIWRKAYNSTYGVILWISDHGHFGGTIYQGGFTASFGFFRVKRMEIDIDIEQASEKELTGYASADEYLRSSAENVKAINEAIESLEDGEGKKLSINSNGDVIIEL